MGSGYFDATVSYDWDRYNMKIEYHGTNNYVEFYQFNPQRGYDPTLGTGQFTFQYLYKTSDDCQCETSNLQDAMPAFYSAAPNDVPSATPTLGKYWPNAFPNDVTLSATKPTTKYLPNSNFQTKNTITGVTKSYNLAQGFWLDPNTKIPAGFSIVDQSNQIRTFTIVTITEMTSATLNLVEPATNCPCQKLVDIVLSLDRSGSISTTQWQSEYQFIKSVAASFTYGPLGANLAIANWNAQQWTTLELNQGISLNVVNSAINSMTCCPNTNAPSCCCCGTPIGGGIYLGGTKFDLGRPQASRVLIVLTDGCQNHLWDAKNNVAISCGCSTEKICATNTTCTADITKYFDIVKKNYPGTTIIAVGVGTTDQICPEQLLLAAGGDTQNVYQVDSWDKLQTIVKTIASTACSLNAVPCTGCCGLCTCGKCFPAPKCKDQDKCNLGKFDNTLSCCRTDPVQCTAPPCQTANCNPLTGCEYSVIPCKTSTDPCFEWACDNTTIVCLRRPAKNAPPSCNGTIIPQCVSNDECSRNDTCTVYNCTAGKCTSKPLFCGNSDNCTTRYCKPTVGCVATTKTCNDGNNCTTDTCQANVLGGCVFTPNAPCKQPPTQCEEAVCDPIKGCINVPRNCSALGYLPNKANCTIPACNITCYNKFICVAPAPTSSETFPQTVILASALGTAAIVGIIIAAAILLAGLGTAAGVAIVGAAGAGGVALVAHNPTYVPSGAAGNNLLYKAND
jgi:hypothetical protein